MHSDHLQPGCMDMRDALVPPIRTMSTFVLSGARVSSGAEKSRASTPAIEPSSRRDGYSVTILKRLFRWAKLARPWVHGSERLSRKGGPELAVGRSPSVCAGSTTRPGVLSGWRLG